VLSVYQSVIDEEKIQREKELLRNNKLAFRQSLDTHIEVSKKLSSKEKEMDQRFIEYVEQDKTRFEEEEKTKKEKLKKKHESELFIRKAQIDEQKERAAKEKLALEAIDIANLQIAKEKAKQEQEAVIAIKIREKEKQKFIKIENEENKKRKALEKEKEAELDFKLMSEYAAKLDRENSEREQLFLAKLKEMEVYAKKFESEGAGKIAKEERMKFEQLILKEQEKKLKSDLEKEQQKEIDRKARIDKMKEDNEKQLMLRSQRKEEEKEIDHQLSEQFKEEERDHYERQRAQAMKKKLGQDGYRHQLDIQRESLKKYDVNLTGITPFEKELNSTTFRNIQNDPKLLTKVLDRIKSK
jgi:hypothetical protein